MATTATESSVDAFLESVAPEARRDDAKQLCAIMADVAQQPPAMWGSAIIGFGSHHYRYASGREGDICRIGFSPRKAANVIYLACDLAPLEAILARLGKHERGAGCLYIKKLENIDRTALGDLLNAAWAAT